MKRSEIEAEAQASFVWQGNDKQTMLFEHEEFVGLVTRKSKDNYDAFCPIGNHIGCWPTMERAKAEVERARLYAHRVIHGCDARTRNAHALVSDNTYENDTRPDDDDPFVRG